MRFSVTTLPGTAGMKLRPRDERPRWAVREDTQIATLFGFASPEIPPMAVEAWITSGPVTVVRSMHTTRVALQSSESRGAYCVATQFSTADTRVARLTALIPPPLISQ